MNWLTRNSSGAAIVFFIGFAAISCISATAQTLSGAYLAGVDAARRGDAESAAKYYTAALSRDPGNLGILEKAVLYQAIAGNLEEAAKLAEALLVSSPGHRISSLILAAKMMREGDFAELRDQLDANPDSYHPLLAATLSAWAAAGDGEPEDGELILREIAVAEPAFLNFSNFHIALLRESAGDAAGAVRIFDEFAGDRATGRVARAYASALVGTGEIERARQVYQNAAEFSLGDDQIEADLSALETKLAEPFIASPAQGAAEAFFGLAAASSVQDEGDQRPPLLYARIASWLNPDLYEARLLTAGFLKNTKQYEAAIHAYELIPTDSALARTAEIGRAETLDEAGRTDEAAEALRALIRRAPGSFDAHLALGDMMRRAMRFSEAALAYDSAVKLMEEAGRGNWGLYYQRGIAYEQSDQWEKAEADFKKALELQPDQPLVLNYLGYSWLVQGRNMDEAVEMIRKAVAQRPGDGFIVDSLGWGYFLAGDYDKAVEQLEQAVELEPADPVLNDHYGDALWMAGRRLEAEFQWKRALSYKPEDEDAVRIRAKLSSGLDEVLRQEAEEAAGGEEAQSGDGG